MDKVLTDVRNSEVRPDEDLISEIETSINKCVFGCLKVTNLYYTILLY